MSAKTGVAPTSAMVSTVAKNVNGVVKTASPGQISRDMRAMSRASVPLEHASACFTPA